MGLSDLLYEFKF